MGAAFYTSTSHATQGLAANSGLSEHSPAGQRDAVVVANDEMVKQPYIDEVQRVSDASRYELVGLAGFSHTRWVVVRQNDRRRVSKQRLFDYFPGIHGGGIDGAAKQFIEGQYPVPVVQKQAAEYFVGPVAQACEQKGTAVRW